MFISDGVFLRESKQKEREREGEWALPAKGQTNPQNSNVWLRDGGWERKSDNCETKEILLYTLSSWFILKINKDAIKFKLRNII